MLLEVEVELVHSYTHAAGHQMDCAATNYGALSKVLKVARIWLYQRF